MYIYIYPVQLNLSFTAHACGNYTIENVSENTHDIGHV